MAIRKQSRIEKLKAAAKAAAQKVSRAQEQSRSRAQESRARAIIAKFKPRKSDRGKLVRVSSATGKRARAGSKSYLVYVTKTGKKWIPQGSIREPFKVRKQVEIPLSRHYKNAAAAFGKAGQKEQARRRSAQPDIREDVARARRIARKEKLQPEQAKFLEKFLSGGRGKGRVSVDTRKTGGLGDDAVDKLSKALQGALQRSATNRQFKIRVLALYQEQGGAKKTFQFDLDIARNDRDVIQIAGVRNFIRQKFYAYLAENLARLGAVSQGSANHVARLKVNRGNEREEWTDKTGVFPWQGRDLETVKLLTIEWKIEQA